MTGDFLLLHSSDNVLVARHRAAEGALVALPGGDVRLSQSIPLAHKIARVAIGEGMRIYKYGLPIGVATADIAPGEHVHIHNIRSDYTPTHALQDADGRSPSRTS